MQAKQFIVQLLDYRGKIPNNISKDISLEVSFKSKPINGNILY